MLVFFASQNSQPHTNNPAKNMYYNATVADTAAVNMLSVDLDSSILRPVHRGGSGGSNELP